MKNKKEIIFVCLFVAIIIITPIISLVYPQKLYSEFENRWLAGVPVYNKVDLYSGKYLNCWNLYLSDRIILRNKLLALNTYFDINILKKPVDNNVVVTKNCLLPYNKPYNFSYSDADKKIDDTVKNITNLSNFTKSNNINFCFLGIPEQVSMLREFYPSFLYDNDKVMSYIEDNFFTKLDKNSVNYINMRKEFLNKDYKNLYSSIDHHYNYMGAFETYEVLIDRINKQTNYRIKPLDKSEVNFQEINMPFYGSRNRKLFNQYRNSEKMFIGNPVEPIPFERFDNGKKVESTVFDLPDNKIGFATYNIYMGGDIAETIIKTNREDKPKILIFGDSFTNPLETLLYYNFNELRSLDYRYYSVKNIYDYIKDYNPDVVVFVKEDVSYLNSEENGCFSIK